jgi:hypothetical protein
LVANRYDALRICGVADGFDLRIGGFKNFESARFGAGNQVCVTLGGFGRYKNFDYQFWLVENFFQTLWPLKQKEPGL